MQQAMKPLADRMFPTCTELNETLCNLKEVQGACAGAGSEEVVGVGDANAHVCCLLCFRRSHGARGHRAICAPRLICSLISAQGSSSLSQRRSSRRDTS